MNDNETQLEEPRCFVIVPAAGHSRRMSSPKLLLPWPSPELADLREAGLVTTVMDSVLHAWTTSRVAGVVVVMRADDLELHQVCARWPVVALTPSAAPVDMKASVQVGLRYIETELGFGAGDFCFIAPADLPTLSASVINKMIEAVAGQTEILLPRFGELSGHPALLPWPITAEIFGLRDDEGVDQIVKRHPKRTVSFSAALHINDIDTDDAYQAALSKLLSSK